MFQGLLSVFGMHLVEVFLSFIGRNESLQKDLQHSRQCGFVTSLVSGIKPNLIYSIEYWCTFFLLRVDSWSGAFLFDILTQNRWNSNENKSEWTVGKLTCDRPFKPTPGLTTSNKTCLPINPFCQYTNIESWQLASAGLSYKKLKRSTVTHHGQTDSTPKTMLPHDRRRVVGD